MMIILWIIIALLAGIAQPVQGGVNASLRKEVNSPYISGAISNFVGATLMLIVGLILHKGPITIPKFQLNQWWIWTGGVLSLVIVLATIIIPSKISYTTFFGAFIAGQLIMAALIDYFGFFGNEPIAMSPQRLIGIALLIIGVILVKK